ncbi:hypothetical protein EDB81DRAFT_875421 [Dactylonectria macrodidyma]|uniref:Uncharacterized protein n=1 Tax=Dactylonectria macrodidyma TaxID=307937 RepID=A0A9P9JNC3_9HYPO|nr:hypothetical protein EDB81DRAFT_875421 [Dactylonectria macrodidyma]
MPTPPSKIWPIGNARSFGISTSNPPDLDCPTTTLEPGSEPHSPNSRETKRYALDSIDDEFYDSSRKRLRAESQAPLTFPPTPLLYLQTPTPSSCLPWTPDLLAEGSGFEKHDSMPHICRAFEPTVSVLSAGKRTKNKSQASEIPDPFDDQELEQLMVQMSDGILTSAPQVLANPDDTEDTFSLADLDEETIAELLSESSLQVNQRPPSSVVRAYDRDSRSANEFDPGLQHSSPYTETLAVAVPFKDDSPLEQEVDWAHVHERAHSLMNGNSPSGSEGTKTLHSVGCLPTRNASLCHIPQSSATVGATPPASKKMFLKPYKTFFCIQEMLSSKVEIFKNQPDIIFELFARVVYSSRENIYRKQYFQFRSLLEESPPYLNGVLNGFEVGGPLDCASQEFLWPNVAGRKCYCRCKLRQDTRSDLGWSILVLSIQSMTWKQIEGVMDKFGRNDLDKV